MDGGVEDFQKDYPISKDDGTTFFYDKWYDGEKARFEDCPVVEEPENEDDKIKFCPSCVRNKEKELVRLSQEKCIIFTF